MIREKQKRKTLNICQTALDQELMNERKITFHPVSYNHMKPCFHAGMCTGYSIYQSDLILFNEKITI